MAVIRLLSQHPDPTADFPGQHRCGIHKMCIRDSTKIIMRLPDQGDRELVGKAAGLNDDQIKELAKLPMGCLLYTSRCV